MKLIKREEGLLSLEACISLMVFIFLMLYLYSFFEVFEARNKMAHVVLSVADSMALDGLINDAEYEGGVISDLVEMIYSYNVSKSDFIANNEWVENENQLQTVIEKRFIAYLANGDVEKANQILENYGIEDGMAGLDFSNSKVEDGNIYISVVYEMEYEFNTFGKDKVRLEQSACSKIWE